MGGVKMWIRKAWKQVEALQQQNKFTPVNRTRMMEQEYRRKLEEGEPSRSVPVEEYMQDPQTQQFMVDQTIERSAELVPLISELLALPTGALKDLARKNALTPKLLDDIDTLFHKILVSL